MALLSNKTVLVGDEFLEGWDHLGSGGFGHVYKARHKEWGFDVAIKLLRAGVSVLAEQALSAEAAHMEEASCEFVLRVYGRYEGCPPFAGESVQQGIVMEFMRGSIESLQRDLRGPPPWPLAFRLAHQVALAMNFLHSRNLIHQDLKPSNVLLNDDLHARLADFGLSRVSTSVLRSDKDMTAEIGGSHKYMPPEAFQASYEPVRALDRYSYGILLWSIFTGREPYPGADYSLVALRIPLGDRPPCEQIDPEQAEGLKELIDLMKRCWDKVPSERPSFKACTQVTEGVLKRQRSKVHDAVHQVLTRLQSTSNNQHSNGFSLPHQSPEQSKIHDNIDGAAGNAERSSKQDSASASPTEMNETDKAKFVDEKRAVLIQSVCEVMAITEELGSMVHDETYALIEAKPTSQDKVRVLYQRTFKSGGVKVKAAFYDALRKHQSDLVERLGG